MNEESHVPFGNKLEYLRSRVWRSAGTLYDPGIYEPSEIDVHCSVLVKEISSVWSLGHGDDAGAG